MPTQAPLTGSCSCKTIRYKINFPENAEIPKIILCHCHSCKTNTGSSFSTNIMVPESNLEFVTGTPKLFLDEADRGRMCRRQFCGDCGAPLTSQPQEGGPMIVVKWGSLDTESRGRIDQVDSEIYARRRDPWLKQIEGDDKGIVRRKWGMTA